MRLIVDSYPNGVISTGIGNPGPARKECNDRFIHMHCYMVVFVVPKEEVSFDSSTTKTTLSAELSMIFSLSDVP